MVVSCSPCRRRSRNPLTSGGRIVDVALEVWAIFVVTVVAGSLRRLLQLRRLGVNRGTLWRPTATNLDEREAPYPHCSGGPRGTRPGPSNERRGPRAARCSAASSVAGFDACKRAGGRATTNSGDRGGDDGRRAGVAPGQGLCDVCALREGDGRRRAPRRRACLRACPDGCVHGWPAPDVGRARAHHAGVRQRENGARTGRGDRRWARPLVLSRSSLATRAATPVRGRCSLLWAAGSATGSDGHLAASRTPDLAR